MPKRLQINRETVSEALGLDADDLSAKELRGCLRCLEDSLDSLARNMDDDHEGARLGDASNLIQLVRWCLKGGK